MQILDERFLSVHPATLVWWSRRDACQSCAYMIPGEADRATKAMRCEKLPTKLPARIDKLDFTYCIDARDSSGGACGPEATLRVPITTGEQT